MFSLSKSKRPEVVDSDDEKMESQQKKRRRIKKPQPDSSDDEGRKEIGGKQGKRERKKKKQAHVMLGKFESIQMRRSVTQNEEKQRKRFPLWAEC